MIVTIDGPAGAGKSTVARALACRLGFRFLDTGAMYRAVALAALNRDLRWGDAESLSALAAELQIEAVDNRVYLDGSDVTDAIRTSRITEVVRYAADSPGVRRHLIELQRQAARGIDLVTEGRDQGTVVFPKAECKVFLTASPQQRAARRLRELRERGEKTTLEQVLLEQDRRDRGDQERPYGGLIAAADAIMVNTDGQNAEQVVDQLEEIVRGAENV